MDACFTGQGRRSVLGKGARPLVTKVREEAFPLSGKLIALTAAQSDQDSGVLESQGHGLFTYYLLKGLDKGALKNGHVTMGGLYRSVLLPHLEWIYLAILRVQSAENTPLPSPHQDPGPSPVLSWFSGEGRNRYGNLPVFASLIKTTKETERTVGSMFDALSLGNRIESASLAHHLLSLKDHLQTLYHSLQKEALLQTLAGTNEKL